MSKRKCPNCKEFFEVDDNKRYKKKFCSSSCSNSRGPRDEEFKNKVSLKLIKPKREFICKTCNIKFIEKKHKKNNSQYCSISCSNKSILKRNKISKKLKSRYDNIEERNRLREIGRYGGFGTKGKTINGTYYSSIFEKKSFDLLENNKIKFIPHKNIPDSSKVSDIYLIDIDTWIELDGINRELKKKYLGKNYQYWKEKLKLYKDKNFNLEIFLKYEDFESFIIKKYNIKTACISSP